MVQSALTKTLLTGVIAGVVGGGAILYGQQGVQLLQNQNQKVSTTATSTKTIAKNATATSAYNKVSDAVVSVLNFTKSSQGSYQESSEGSGVIYKKTDGSAFIVTNNHVITGAAKNSSYAAQWEESDRYISRQRCDD